MSKPGLEFKYLNLELIWILVFGSWNFTIMTLKNYITLNVRMGLGGELL